MAEPALAHMEALASAERPPRWWGTIPLSVLLVSMAATLACLAVFAEALFGHSVLFAAFGWLLVAAFAIVLARLEPTLFVMSFMLFLAYMGAITGGLLIESGVYVSEQARYGFATGSTIRLAFYWLVFLTVSTIGIRAWRSGPRRGPDAVRLSTTWRWSLYALAGVLAAVVFAGLIVNGSPLLERTDRFTYWRTNAIPFLQPIHNQASTAVFLVGLAFVFAPRKLERAIALFIALAFLVYFVFQGEKFTALTHVVFAFLLPVAVRTLSAPGATIPPAKTLVAGAILSGALTSLILFQYQTVFGSAEPVARLVQRIALQGHVWWGVDERIRAGELPVEPETQRAHELAALLKIEPPTDEVGMALLMRTVAPLDLVERYERQGIRFTMGYPAIGLYLFGPIGLLVLQAVAAMLFVGLFIYMSWAIGQARVLHGVVAYKLYYELHGPFTMGNLHDITNAKILVFLALVLLALAIDHMRPSRRSQNA